MKLKDYIRKLQEFDPDAVVLLTDWNEAYASPSEEVAERIDYEVSDSGHKQIFIGGGPTK